MQSPRLVPLDAGNWRDALAVRPHPEQLRFVAEFEPVALVILAKAYVGARALRWHPFAVTLDGDMVGLVGLAHPKPPGECEICHLVIDVAHQNRGLGRAVLGLAADWARRELPACRRLLLTVHPENAIARRLYEQAGFQPLGYERDGETVMARAL